MELRFCAHITKKNGEMKNIRVDLLNTEFGAFIIFDKTMDELNEVAGMVTVDEDMKAVLESFHICGSDGDINYIKFNISDKRIEKEAEYYKESIDEEAYFYDNEDDVSRTVYEPLNTPVVACIKEQSRFGVHTYRDGILISKEYHEPTIFSIKKTTHFYGCTGVPVKEIVSFIDKDTNEETEISSRVVNLNRSGDIVSMITKSHNRTASYVYNQGLLKLAVIKGSGVDRLIEYNEDETPRKMTISSSTIVRNIQYAYSGDEQDSKVSITDDRHYLLEYSPEHDEYETRTIYREIDTNDYRRITADVVFPEYKEYTDFVKDMVNNLKEEFLNDIEEDEDCEIEGLAAATISADKIICGPGHVFHKDIDDIKCK